MSIRLPRFLCLVLISSSAMWAAITPPPISDTSAKSEQGLILTLSAGGKSDTRAARLVSLYAPAGQPISPFLPSGAFTAKWEGDITSGLRGEYTFAAKLKGKLKLSINGQPVLEGTGESDHQLPANFRLLHRGRGDSPGAD